MLKLKKKRAITLLEIMIVIFLIGLIGSVVGYNMKGSLDEGKSFKTTQAQKQLKDILLLEAAKGESLENIVKDPKYYLERSGLAKSPQDLLKDGWGKEFEIKAAKDKEDLLIISENLIKYEKKKGKNRPSSEDEEAEF